MIPKPPPTSTPSLDDHDPKTERTPPRGATHRMGNVYTLNLHSAQSEARTLPMGSGVARLAAERPSDTALMVAPAAFEANAALDLAASLELPFQGDAAPPASRVAPTPAAHVPTPAHEDQSGIKAKVTAPRFDVMKVNKAVVSSYKFMGFAVLATILAGLASFIATNLFYIFNDSWVTPMQLSATDPRVLQLNAQYSAEKAARDGVATQRLELEARLSDAQRIVTSEENFQKAFDEAMKADLADRSGELADLRALISNLQRTRREVTQANADYTTISKDELKKQFAAGLIDTDQHVKGGYELAQIAGANLALHEKNVEIDARITDVKRQVASLQTAGAHGGGAMSYEILHMRHEYEQSVLASKKAQDDGDALVKSIGMMDKTIADYDAQLTRISKAPYMMAADKAVNTAFVPYDNVGAVQLGDKVYSCALSFLACHAIGTVAEELDGEVIGKHPLHNREMRGVLVRLALDDPKAIEKPVLHLHRAPLGI